MPALNPRAAPAAIVFDFDGSLVDSMAGLLAATNRVLVEEKRRPLTLTELQPMLGGGAPMLVKRAFRLTGAPTVDVGAAVARWRAYYDGCAPECTVLFPGVASVLVAFAARGLALGICTGKPVGSTLKLLHALGIRHFFRTVQGHAFARGVGAAMNKDPANARVELARLQQIRETAAALKINDWVEQIEIQSDVVRGLATYAEGKHDEAIALLRKAAEREEATEKHAVMPGLIVPAREVLGRVMLEVAKPGDALREFEAVIEREPNRYRAFAGAFEAAERAGDANKTAHYSARLVELTASADTPRAEIARAKRLLGK